MICLFYVHPNISYNATDKFVLAETPEEASKMWMEDGGHIGDHDHIVRLVCDDAVSMGWPDTPGAVSWSDVPIMLKVD